MSQNPAPSDPSGPPFPASSPRPPVDPLRRSAPPPPPPGYPPIVYGGPPPRGGSWITRILTSILVTVLFSSIVLNIYFIVLFAASMHSVSQHVLVKGDLTKRIVVVPINGMIDEEKAAFVREAMRSLHDAPPDAVILRVDSGGGGVGASDRIWHEITEFRKATAQGEKKIPIVASYGSLAASGGYYVSVLADHIVAEPTCITGSIGVIAPAYTIDRLLDKVGVTPEVITATPSTQKDVANNIMRPWNERDRETLRVVLDHAADRFIDIVAKGRAAHLKPEEVKELATGRIFTAEEAKTAKLVDDVGYLEDAIDKAKSLAGMGPGDKPQVMMISPSQHLSLLNMLTMTAPARQQSFDGESIRRIADDLATPRVEYRVNFR